MSPLRQQWSDLRLRGKGTVVITIPLVVLALATVLFYVIGHFDRQAQHDVEHSEEVSHELAVAQTLITQAASDNRAYVLLGEQSYLAAAQQEERALGQELTTLQAQVGDNPTQSARIAQVRRDMAALPPPPSVSVPAAPATPGVSQWLDSSRQTTENAQKTLVAADQTEAGLLTHRHNVADRWRTGADIGAALLLALGVLGGIGGVRLFTKSIAQRVDALERDISRSPGEEFDGPPDESLDELGDLARRLRATLRALEAREIELREVRAFLENIVTVSPVVVMRTTGGAEATYVSPNCEHALGLSAAEAGATKFWEANMPGSIDSFFSRAGSLFDPDGPEYLEWDAPVMVRGERRFWNILLARESASSAEHGVLVFVLDVTARRVAEEEAADRQRRLGAITAASPDIIAVFDAQMRVVWTSEAVVSLLGYRATDRAGAPTPLPVHDEDRRALADAVRSVISGAAEDFTVRVRARHANRRWIALEGHGRPLLGPDGAPHLAVAVFRDVTERIALEAELVEARDLANAASGAKSEFLSRMSHELRTPLNVVLGFTQLLQMEVAGDEQRAWIDQILRAGRHLLDLINEVLDIARIESGAMALSPEAVALHDVITETVEAMTPIASAHEVTIATPIGSGELHVRADRQRLKQVLLNLLSNAVKYNRPGGTITVTTEVTPDDQTLCHISDTGIGIAPQYLERLFVPFDRLGAENTGIEGTGVGLSLSLRLVEAMDGDLTVESVQGGGSTFTISLPRMGSPTEDAVRDGSLREAIDGADVLEGPAGTVLYVEDNLSNLQLMQRVIDRRPGVRLVHAARGELGLELARSMNPDIVLLDMHLPDMSGADVLARLRGGVLTSAIPIFIVSADATVGQVSRMEDAGASGYLTKPLDVRRVLALLDDILDNRVSAHEGDR